MQGIRPPAGSRAVAHPDPAAHSAALQPLARLDHADVSQVGRQLIEGLRNPTLVHDTSALRDFAVRPVGVEARDRPRDCGTRAA